MEKAIPAYLMAIGRRRSPGPRQAPRMARAHAKRAPSFPDAPWPL